MGKRNLSGLAVTVAALGMGMTFAGAVAAPQKHINVFGDPNITLALIPSHLPDGKPVDQVYLINRSARSYCFRFEVYDDAFIYVPKRVTILTAPPRSAYQVTKVKIIAAGGKYRFKMDGAYLDDVEGQMQGRPDCRKAFPRRRTAYDEE